MARATQDENSLLRRIERTARCQHSPWLTLGIGDDAALFSVRSGYQAVLTCDWFLEGSHFLPDKHPADSVGWKCLARAVSDIAAMGGVPRCFLLSLALPDSHTQQWMDQFLSGLARAAQRFGCPLAGGDTTRRKDILINVTVAGEVMAGRALRRSGAKPGDILYVSGRLGEAELGLRILQQMKHLPNAKASLLKRHLYPEPRLALGRWLVEKNLTTALMDLSDGLSSDLPRLCFASGTGARVEAANLPAVQGAHLAAQRGLDLLQLALHGGEDYELLFTVPRSKARHMPKSFKGLTLTAIGEITRQRRLLLMNENGRIEKLAAGGWDPFGKTKSKIIFKK